MWGDDALIPVSAINHFLFCERRCALIHMEGVFRENAHTLEGAFLHERADAPGVENRPGVRIVRALPLFSRQLGLTGKADIVEFHKQADGSEVPLPVDYKRGPRRKWDNDDAQLCAQALCLEEMLGLAVPAGAVFHAASKRRREVAFTPELRAMTEAAVRDIRALLASGRVPPPVLKPRCDGCSLRQICMPEVVSDKGMLSRHMRAVFDGNLDARSAWWPNAKKLNLLPLRKKEAVNAQVFVQFRPMNAITRRGDLKMFKLSFIRGGQFGVPRQRNDNGAPIAEVHGHGIFRELDSLDGGQGQLFSD